jgi:hypothetical protein
MSKIYYTANVLFKTDEGSRNWCMGFSWAGGSLSPLRMNRAFSYTVLTDLAESLALDVASARWSHIQICGSSSFNMGAGQLLFDLQYSIASILSMVSSLVSQRLMWTSTWNST